MKATRRHLDSVALRLALLLAVALFPIGLIAVLQSRHIAEAQDLRSEAALLSLTSEAATREMALVRTAFGAIGALRQAIPIVRDDPETCSGLFRDFVRDNPSYSFAGYVDAQGKIVCGNAGVGLDGRDSAVYRAQKAEPARRTDVNLRPRVSKTSVIVMSEPLVQDGPFDGYIAFSLPHALLYPKGPGEGATAALDGADTADDVDLITFNGQGNVISAQRGLEAVAARLPKDRPLASLVQERRFTFTGLDASGREMAFAVVPMMEGTLYALGAWPRERFVFSSRWTVIQPLVLPALMWIACLWIAYFGVHRLVVKHIKRLRHEMNSFIRTRRFDPPPPSRTMPREIREIETTWLHLAETVTRDEAELEDTIREKSVLLKEVHHRVKNNLQLITSIINMKLRKVRAPEVRGALQDIQMRVMSIASVHRSLYEGDDSGRVAADELLRAVVDMTLETAMHSARRETLSIAYDPIQLFPDQAVPLSLLAGEAVTNALKYHGASADQAPWISVRLERTGPQAARLSVANSVSPENSENGAMGMGFSLINAFVTQMRGRTRIDREDGLYRIVVDFPIVDFDAQAEVAPVPVTAEPRVERSEA